MQRYLPCRTLEMGEFMMDRGWGMERGGDWKGYQMKEEEWDQGWGNYKVETEIHFLCNKNNEKNRCNELL